MYYEECEIMGEVGESPGWRQSPGWMKLLLIVSLSVNVAVIGLIGGNAVRHWDRGSYGKDLPNEPGLDRRQSRVLQMVPDARRDEARAIMLARQDEYGDARASMMAAQQGLIDAIRQEPLDAERLAAALVERRAASSAVWDIGYGQIAEIARRLNAAERSEMADRLEERTRRWMERQEGKGR
jgi:uncharacterized membrane protein